MRIVMTQNLANRRAGERVEIDPGSGEWLIARDYARDAGSDQGDGELSPPTPRQANQGHRAGRDHAEGGG